MTDSTSKALIAQYESIDMERLRKALAFFGISAPVSMEELGFSAGDYINKLTLAIVNFEKVINAMPSPVLPEPPPEPTRVVYESLSCNKVRQEKGLPLPRTCQRCGLGPCNHVRITS